MTLLTTMLAMLAILLPVATALPTILTTTTADGRAATLYSATFLHGSGTAIPPNAQNNCVNLNNLFGNVDGTTRSVKTERGYRCNFYT